MKNLIPLALLLTLTGCTTAEVEEFTRRLEAYNNSPQACIDYADSIADAYQPPQRARCTTLDFSTNCSITPPPPTRQERYDAALRQCEANR